MPLVNVDGFNVSREAPSVPIEERFSFYDLEYRRKNCRLGPGVINNPIACNLIFRNVGVDPNRNYGGFWGGPGASTNPLNDTYRGEAPFSEPEVQNIKDLVGTRNVTNLITNHTFSNLVLRPPGVQAAGFPVEEPLYRELGGQLADANLYANIPSFGLYDTTGGTEDWTFWTQGSMGFTFEIGLEGFHEPFADHVVGEYLGLEPAEGAGRGGNREAYYRMLEATADRQYHSQIRGTAPVGSTLRIEKEFQTSTSPVIQPDGTVGPPIVFDDALSAETETAQRRFTWSVTPSTRPVVAGRYGREPNGTPSAPITLTNPAGQPAENPAGNYRNGEYEVATFTVPGGAGVDNGSLTVTVDWATDATDWDIFVLDSNGVQIASAATGNPQENAIAIDPAPGEYTVVFVNYDQVNGAPYDDWTGQVTFQSPQPGVVGTKEAWNLTCEREDGRPTVPQAVEVDRGERADVGAACRVGTPAQIAKARRGK